jgi:hypothetical protein
MSARPVKGAVTCIDVFDIKMTMWVITTVASKIEEADKTALSGKQVHSRAAQVI